MRIGIAIQWMSRRNGGVFESARLACETLVAANLGEIHVFTTDDPHIAEDAGRIAGIRLHVCREYGSQRLGFAPAMLGQMRRADIDLMIVHGLWTWHSLAAFLWCRLTGRPCIVVPHGMLEPWIMQRSSAVKKLFWHGFTRSLIERAKAVQMLNEPERESVALLTNKARPVIISNFVPTRTDDPVPPQWRDRDYDGKTVFLFFGRLHEKKGIVELCEAWRSFNRDEPALAAGCRLVFCGWVDGMPDFEEMVADIARSHGNIRFAGPQYGDEKWRSMAAADFMLLPSKSEGLPMSILEGWSLGLPAIMTDACNLPLGFEYGAALRTGMAAGDIVTSLIEAAHMTPARKAEMGDAARRLIHDHYSEPAFRDSMTRLITDAVHG